MASLTSQRSFNLILIIPIFSIVILCVERPKNRGFCDRPEDTTYTLLSMTGRDTFIKNEYWKQGRNTMIIIYFLWLVVWLTKIIFAVKWTKILS